LDTIALTKKGDEWIITSAADYPAEKKNVEKVLKELVGLKAGEPIASNAANHNALKVGEKEYGRRVKVTTSSGVKSLVLGNGPGQSVHVRVDNKDDVYRARGLSIWTLSTSLSSYLDTNYLKIDKDKLSSVQVTNPKGELNFTKEGDNWMLAQLPPGGMPDQKKIDQYIGSVSKLTMNEPIGKEAKPEYGLDSGTKVKLTFTEDDKPKTVSYSIGAKKDDSYFYGKADDKDYVVTLSKWITEDAREKIAADFLKTEKGTDE
jgi:hypothetical protein